VAIGDTVRKYVEAGREALTPKKAEDLARSLAKQGEVRKDQVSRLARDLAEWSRRNSERLMEIVRSEVKRQMSRTGVATKDEVEALRRRVRELERGRPKVSAAKKSSTAKRTTTRKSTGSRKT
jgi:polyhydroxyalkanoate synthesis regulator phasin